MTNPVRVDKATAIKIIEALPGVNRLASLNDARNTNYAMKTDGGATSGGGFVTESIYDGTNISLYNYGPNSNISTLNTP